MRQQSGHSAGRARLLAPSKQQLGGEGTWGRRGPGLRKHGVLTRILLKELLREESVPATAPPPPTSLFPLSFRTTNDGIFEEAQLKTSQTRKKQRFLRFRF